jgi:hypothetical protein
LPVAILVDLNGKTWLLGLGRLLFGLFFHCVTFSLVCLLSDLM